MCVHHPADFLGDVPGESLVLEGEMDDAHDAVALLHRHPVPIRDVVLLGPKRFELRAEATPSPQDVSVGGDERTNRDAAVPRCSVTQVLTLKCGAFETVLNLTF